MLVAPPAMTCATGRHVFRGGGGQKPWMGLAKRPSGPSRSHPGAGGQGEKECVGVRLLGPRAPPNRTGDVGSPNGPNQAQPPLKMKGVTSPTSRYGWANRPGPSGPKVLQTTILTHLCLALRPSRDHPGSGGGRNRPKLRKRPSGPSRDHPGGVYQATGHGVRQADCPAVCPDLRRLHA